ncbi:MAG: hypothetical protein M1834_004951 [Cirrosporium novae-zelandiae]|nr:MAG: hypothetical protein M1834_004951 [Cirrosporium novae-zelandiae]
MPSDNYNDEEERKPLNQGASPRNSIDSTSSVSTTSLVLEGLSTASTANSNVTFKNPFKGDYKDDADGQRKDTNQDEYDLEEGPYASIADKPIDGRAKRALWILIIVCVGGWLLALFLFIARRGSTPAYASSSIPSSTANSGKSQIAVSDIIQGGFRARSHGISWIKGANGEDGLLMEQDAGMGQDYLVVKDIRSRKDDADAMASMTLIKAGGFRVGDKMIFPSKVWPSPDLKKVLCLSDYEKNWRHSFYGKYWIFDVATQTAEPLDPGHVNGRVQLASWSPQSDAIVFTRDNNLFLRKLSAIGVTQITHDGGTECFYGIPDWVYEEEVFQGNSVTWWAEDGKYIVFMRTNESAVPVYPVPYFVSRPSGTLPKPGEENYPEIRNIKYPKAGAPNPVVDMRFYDVAKYEVFEVDIDGGFEDNDRLFTEVTWAGSSGKVLIKEVNRQSDKIRTVLVDVTRREGQVVRTVDFNALDGGWAEPSQDTHFIPSDPANGRPHDGYITTIVHENNDHLAYFTPIDNPEPIMLTLGDWEVVSAPSSVDLTNNLVYFIATKESPIQRHIYSVKLDGTGLKPLTDTTKEGYYSASFSSGSGYVLLTYKGPDIPWQKVISTPNNKDKYQLIIEENKDLAAKVKDYSLPTQHYSTVTIDGFTLQVVERRPPNFDKNKKYPVMFHLYGGPGSQTVSKMFNVDFQAYLTATLGYVVVTVDGRGTGFIGRKARCIIRGNIGFYEAKDQIETAKIWAKKPYVDASRIAIWGWSYGGFMTLKTLEQDGGNTFQYGMAVAPVTDWRYYDSIYTERYMRTPQNNPQGYESTAITNMTALGNNVRFLVMHGVADDNVHTQNTFTLLDKLDLAGVENYDEHVFPDSDHSIYFHNANLMVYDRLKDWLINAFNGEWVKLQHPTPAEIIKRIIKRL